MKGCYMKNTKLLLMALCANPIFLLGMEQIPGNSILPKREFKKLPTLIFNKEELPEERVKVLVKTTLIGNSISESSSDKAITINLDECFAGFPNKDTIGKNLGNFCKLASALEEKRSKDARFQEAIASIVANNNNKPDILLELLEIIDALGYQTSDEIQPNHGNKLYEKTIQEIIRNNYIPEEWFKKYIYFDNSYINRLALKKGDKTNKSILDLLKEDLDPAVGGFTRSAHAGFLPKSINSTSESLRSEPDDEHIDAGAISQLRIDSIHQLISNHNKNFVIEDRRKAKVELDIMQEYYRNHVDAKKIAKDTVSKDLHKVSMSTLVKAIKNKKGPIKEQNDRIKSKTNWAIATGTITALTGIWSFAVLNKTLLPEKYGVNIPGVDYIVQGSKNISEKILGLVGKAGSVFFTSVLPPILTAIFAKLTYKLVSDIGPLQEGLKPMAQALEGFNAREMLENKYIVTFKNMDSMLEDMEANEQELE